MTQTTLFSDKQLFVSLYKSALRRMKGMFLIYTLLSFITYPMPYVMECIEAAERAALGYSYYGFVGTPEVYTTMSALLYFAVVIAGAVLISVYCNSFMHNRRAVDVFHALPAKRSVMLLANFAAVATILITAQLLCYSVVAAAEFIMLRTVPVSDFAVEFFRVLLVTMLIVAVTFFCCVCCNASFDSAVFSGAFMVIVPAYAFLFYAVMEIFVVGCDVMGSQLLTSVKFSPVIMMYQTFMDGEITHGVLLSIIYIAAVVLLMAAACRIYTKRKSEVAQSANTANFLYQFIILAASTGGGIMFGIFFNEIFGYYNYNILWLISISCIFSAAIYLVFNGIMSRNPRPTKRGLAGLGASLVIVAAFLFCVDNGFFGYESYVPATDNVKSVNINYSGDYDEIMIVHSSKNGAIWTGTNSLGVTFTDPDEIDMVRDIHNIIVNNIDKETDLFYRNIRITYELKSGRTVSRAYYHSVPVEIIPILTALEDLESFKTQLYPVLYADVSLVKNFDIKDGFGQNLQTLRNLTDEQKAKLYNAMAQDTINITRQMKDQRTGPVLARISVNYKEMSEEVYNSLIKQETTEVLIYDKTYVEPHSTGYPIYENVIFDVTQDCINTIRALDELGLSQYTTLTVPENMKAVVMTSYSPLDYNSNKPYWKTNTTFDQYNFMDYFRWEEPSRIEEYTDPQQVAQLAQASRVSLYAPRQEKALYAVAFMENDVDWREMEAGSYECMLYYIPNNAAPDYVKQDLAEYDVASYFGYYGKMGT